MATVVCLNGEPVAPEKAVVSVFDRGFLYGDSVYEVVRTYRGVPFELDAHLTRLAGSAERIAMELPVPLSTLAEEVRRAHAVSGNEESYLRVVVTRGAGEIGLDPALAETPIRVIIAQTLKTPGPDVYAQGAKVVLVAVRRNLRTAVDPQAKTGNYLNSVMALAEARKCGGYEALMLDHRDLVTEGASSNVFLVVSNVLLTPSLDVGILRGVTRQVVIDVARRAGMRVLEVPVVEDMLKSADEVFITSSIREIVPVVKVDESVIGSGRPGPVYQRIRSEFAAHVEAYARRYGRSG